MRTERLFRLVRPSLILIAGLALLLVPAGARVAGGDCIDYGDYLHWVGNVGGPGKARGVAVSGTVAYVAGDYSGLQVIDVSNPASPAILGSVDTPGYAYDVVVSGTVAYVADGSSLQVIDVSNPASPAILGSVDTPGWNSGVAVSGTVAYVAEDYSGLQVIDVSNPVSPAILGSVDTPGDAYSVAVFGTVAYVAGRDAGLQVVDVSNPVSPAILGSVDTPGDAYAVAVSGTVAYVADWNAGLLTLPSQCNATTAVHVPGESVELRPVLGQAFPNPVRGGASTIRFTLSQAGIVKVRILDLAGREVRMLLDEATEKGDQSILWDGRNDRGAVVPAGIYLYQLLTSGFEATRKLVRLK